MASNVLPPNPCLVAVALVVKTKSEPRLIFHYPQNPGEDITRYQNMINEDADSESSSSTEGSGESSSDEDSPSEDAPPTAPKEAEASPKEADEDDHIVPSKDFTANNGGQSKQWNDLFGYEAGVIAKLLCPPSSSHKKKVEIGLDGKVFVGQPAYAGPEGSWRKKKKRRSSSTSAALNFGSVSEDLKTSHEIMEDAVEDAKSDNDDGHANTGETEAVPVWQGDDLVLSPVSSAKRVQDYNFPNPATGRQSEEEKSKSSLNMFHVSFILDPPPLEYHLRVKEMYDSVIRKVTKALRWEQARSNYVAKEASIITSTIKRLSRGDGTSPNVISPYKDLFAQSALAKAIAILYNCITASRIAHVTLTPRTSLSFQIFAPASISHLPSPLSPQLPGLWLTTATSMPIETTTQGPGSQLGAHFGLLLLADLDTILADIAAASSPIKEPLSHYLKISTPAKSFAQISQISGISLIDIQSLASHLIFWRRARAVPPLNQRDTYIVSPNADMRNLVSASAAFSKSFPSLPSLPKILEILSMGPRPFRTLIPHKDYKLLYLDVLAWLMRHGWVTQLRTFTWVQVPPSIANRVNRELLAQGDSHGQSVAEADAREPTASTADPHIPRLAISSPPSSTATAIRLPAEETTTPIIIPNPRLASSRQSRYLSAIAQHVRESQGEDMHTAWETCVNYFDGKFAMESIGIIEGWKKKRTTELINSWEKLGVLLKCRHW